MQIYLYAKSGHSIGLEATRRCAAIASRLKEFDPILATCDFRAGAYCKDNLEIRKYVNVDVLSNLPNMMKRGDILIFDSNEASDFMEKHMGDFCSLLYKVGKDIPSIIIDNNLFTKVDTPKYDATLFFGDDDYDNKMLKLIENSSKQKMNLQLGHYFFLGNEDKLKPFFENLFEDEDYVETIKNSKYLLTTTLNSCLESIACENRPVLLLRDDKEYNMELISEIGIPTINYNESLDKIAEEFETIINAYPNLNYSVEFDFNTIIEEIKAKVELFNKVNNIK